jgi:hypothetical protein
MREIVILSFVVTVLSACASSATPEPSVPRGEPSPHNLDAEAVTQSQPTAETTQAAPSDPLSQPQAEGTVAPLPAAARAVLLRARCASMTKRKCSPEEPCCNACMSVHWETAQPGELARADGEPYAFDGAQLPSCAWPAGQCGCDFDVRAEGHVRGGAFVVESAQKVRRAP